MKLHRYYVHEHDLRENLSLKEQDLLNQWNKVLRYKKGREVVLFNSARDIKKYRIDLIDKKEVHLSFVSNEQVVLPKKEVYLCFSLLKKDKNEWILQKATELGVSHFTPLITDRTEKTGFNMDRARKIVIEAAEQCGRADIPSLSEPQNIEKTLDFLKKTTTTVLIAEQSQMSIDDAAKDVGSPIAVLIGPEGGWTDQEKTYFKDNKLHYVAISDFTLRAETAAISAVSLLQ